MQYSVFLSLEDTLSYFSVAVVEIEFLRRKGLFGFTVLEDTHEREGMAARSGAQQTLSHPLERSRKGDHKEGSG